MGGGADFAPACGTQGMEGMCAIGVRPFFLENRVIEDPPIQLNGKFHYSFFLTPPLSECCAGICLSYCVTCDSLPTAEYPHMTIVTNEHELAAHTHVDTAH